MQVKASLFLFVFVMMLSFSVDLVDGEKKAPDFTLVDIDGNEFLLSNQHGKVVIINFFAIDCYYCGLEMPHLRILYEEYPSNQFMIISISVDLRDTNEDLRNFAHQYNVEWTVARDTANVGDKYGVSPIPHLIVVDAEGYKRYEHIGLTEETKLRLEIDALLSGAENGDSEGNSGTEQTGPPYTLIAIIGSAVVFFLVIGIVVASHVFQWSKPAKKRRKHEH